MPILVPGRAIKCQQKLLRGDGDEYRFSSSAPETQPVVSPMTLMKKKWLGKEKTSATISTVAAKKPVKTTKIRFNENVRVRATLHVDEITDEEFFKTWYSKDEMKEMKKDMARDLKRWLRKQHREKKGETAGEDEPDMTQFTSRGLEHRTKKGTLQRKRNRYLAVQAVLNEQEEQLVCGITTDSDVLIRSAYLKGGSKRCTMEAIQFGNGDAKEAEAVYDNQEIENEVRADVGDSTDDGNSEEQQQGEKEKAVQEEKKKKDLMALNLLIDEQLGFGKQEHKTEGTVGLVAYEDVIQPISDTSRTKKKSSSKSEDKKKSSAAAEVKKSQPPAEKKSKKLMQKLQNSVSSATSSKRRARFNVFK